MRHGACQHVRQRTLRIGVSLAIGARLEVDAQNVGLLLVQPPTLLVEDEGTRLSAVHRRWAHWPYSRRRSRNSARARDNLDLTVPTAHPMTFAISTSVIPSRSRRMTDRKS